MKANNTKHPFQNYHHQHQHHTPQHHHYQYQQQQQTSSATIQYFQYPLTTSANSTSITPVNASPISSSLTSSPSTPIHYHPHHHPHHINNFNYQPTATYHHNNHNQHHGALAALNGGGGGGLMVATQQHQQFQQLHQFNSFHSATVAPNFKDTRWLTLEVCREFQRNKCNRTEIECKFAHPLAHVEIINGKVIACYDSLKVSFQLLVFVYYSNRKIKFLINSIFRKAI